MPKTKALQNKLTITVDTREKLPWSFRASDWLSGTIDRKLDTGDYAVTGLEHLCVVDRKKSTAELSANFFEDRFYRELERMKDIAYPIIVCEFPYSFIENFPEGSGIPAVRRRFLRVTSHLLLRRLCEAQVKYPHVHWHFAGSQEAARSYTRGLFKRIVEQHYKVTL